MAQAGQQQQQHEALAAQHAALERELAEAQGQGRMLQAQVGCAAVIKLLGGGALSSLQPSFWGAQLYFRKNMFRPLRALLRICDSLANITLQCLQVEPNH
jgi:hypothetical protein